MPVAKVGQKYKIIDYNPKICPNSPKGRKIKNGYSGKVALLFELKDDFLVSTNGIPEMIIKPIVAR